MPYNGFGARAIKQLAAKILLALFPPSQPFVRIQIDEKHMKSFNLDEAGRGKVEQALAATEKMLVSLLEEKGLRSTLYEAVKQLLICGNTLLYVGKDRVRLYKLDKYVTERDSRGVVTSIIVCEKIKQSKLPADLQAKLGDKLKAKKNGDFKLHTYVYKQGGTWRSHQEVEGIQIKDSASVYREDKNPWIPLTLNLVDGEPYSRSFTEEHLGDLNTLESLTKAITQAAVAASKVIFLVKPNATTRPVNLQKAKNGDFVNGDRDDVGALQLDKAADFNIAKQLQAEITKGLSEAFLMTGAVRRDAERVTAEEVRVMSRMLEEALGGLYSQLATSLQLPLVNACLAILAQEQRLPPFKKGLFKPVVITGVEGLGREADLSRLNALVGLVQQLGAEVVSSEINIGELIARYAASLSIDTTGLIKTQQQKQQEAQQQQQQQLMQQATPALVQQATKGIEQ